MSKLVFKTVVTHWVKIVVYSKRTESPVEVLVWNQMPFSVRSKWAWYFRYRQALLQVKYPRYEVDMTWGNQEPNDNQLKHSLINKIRAKKAKITSYENKLNAFVCSWNSFFPVQQDIAYKKALVKINELKNELLELEKELPCHE